MAMPSVLVVLPLVLATLLVTSNAQNYTAPTPSPLQDTPSSPPPPAPEPSTVPPPASAPPSAPSSPPPPPASSPPPPSPSPPPPAYSPPPSPSPPPPSSNWTPVANVSDPKIQQVAQFAVRIHALSSKELNMQLLKVVSGETQPSNGGYNYRLVVTVSGSKNTQYDAFVWGILGTTSWKLLSFMAKY